MLGDEGRRFSDIVTFNIMILFGRVAQVRRNVTPQGEMFPEAGGY